MVAYCLLLVDGSVPGVDLDLDLLDLGSLLLGGLLLSGGGSIGDGPVPVGAVGLVGGGVVGGGVVSGGVVGGSVVRGRAVGGRVGMVRSWGGLVVDGLGGGLVVDGLGSGLVVNGLGCWGLVGGLLGVSGLTLVPHVGDVAVGTGGVAHDLEQHWSKIFGDTKDTHGLPGHVRREG